jgi:hypothetical protein
MDVDLGRVVIVSRRRLYDRRVVGQAFVGMM